jgi:hypothetical protein
MVTLLVRKLLGKLLGPGKGRASFSSALTGHTSIRCYDCGSVTVGDVSLPLQARCYRLLGNKAR